MKKGTKTSQFGVLIRESHDSTLFYDSRLYEDFRINEEKSEIENPIPPDVLDRTLLQDSRDMGNIPDTPRYKYVCQ